jgi:hypothetical protein
VPAQSSFDYAIIRVVPRVEREEFLNAGAVLFCLEQDFLEARMHLDEKRLAAIWPELDLQLIRDHLQAFVDICAGHPDGDPIATLTRRERFHWLVSPKSTIVQVSPVHSGLCEVPDDALNDLFRNFVLVPST